MPTLNAYRSTLEARIDTAIKTLLPTIGKCDYRMKPAKKGGHRDKAWRITTDNTSFHGRTVILTDFDNGEVMVYLSGVIAQLTNVSHPGMYVLAPLEPNWYGLRQQLYCDIERNGEQYQFDSLIIDALPLAALVAIANALEDIAY